jgi:hypothetical protein
MPPRYRVVLPLQMTQSVSVNKDTKGMVFTAINVRLASINQIFPKIHVLPVPQGLIKTLLAQPNVNYVHTIRFLAYMAPLHAYNVVCVIFMHNIKTLIVGSIWVAHPAIVFVTRDILEME